VHPHPAQAVVLLHRRDRPPGRPLRPRETQRDELVVGDIGADFAIGAFDPLLDLGQELINQHRPPHPANSQAGLSDGDIPGDGVMRDPGELAGITQRPGQIKRI
jgi:hypothetical protein